MLAIAKAVSGWLLAPTTILILLYLDELIRIFWFAVAVFNHP